MLIIIIVNDINYMIFSFKNTTNLIINLMTQHIFFFFWRG